MAAHQRGGLVAQRTGKRGAECRGLHQHVGVARDLADVEYRHTPSYETCHVIDRPERDVACAEGDDRRGVVVHHGLDFGPDLVDFSMNEALEVHSGVASIHRLAVEAELQDVVRGDRLRCDRAGNEVAVGILVVPDADMAVTVHDLQSGEDAVCRHQVLDQCGIGRERFRPCLARHACKHAGEKNAAAKQEVAPFKTAKCRIFRFHETSP